MAINYSRRTLIQRCIQDVSKDFPSSEFPISENEVHLYLDQAIAFTCVGNIYAGAKLSGVLEVPEGYLATFQMDALVQDVNTGEWYATLPQVPLSLPIGYSVTDAYLANPTNGQSQSVLWVKAKRRPFRDFMPKPSGIHGRLENERIYLKATNGQPLSEETLFVQMPSTRNTDLDAILTIPDDAIESVFEAVTAKMRRRLGMPLDAIKDDLPVNTKTQ